MVVVLRAVVVAIGTVLVGVNAYAVLPAAKCEAAKLKIAGKYSLCRLKAQAKTVKLGPGAETSGDFGNCDATFADKWSAAEAKGGASCPTSGDATRIQSLLSQLTTSAGFTLGGVRFVDNGDGTITDVYTGLMWEQKTADLSVHDRDNVFTWSATGTAPDGTAYTSFLAVLNGTSADGNIITGCFAGHCDWRLPTSVELQTILLAPFPCGTNPCIDPVFGSAQSAVQDYFSATTYGGDPSYAWAVEFSDGFATAPRKTLAWFVRAVRGGL